MDEAIEHARANGQGSSRSGSPRTAGLVASTRSTVGGRRYRAPPSPRRPADRDARDSLPNVVRNQPNSPRLHGRLPVRRREALVLHPAEDEAGAPCRGDGEPRRRVGHPAGQQRERRPSRGWGSRSANGPGQEKDHPDPHLAGRGRGVPSSPRTRQGERHRDPRASSHGLRRARLVGGIRGAVVARPRGRSRRRRSPASRRGGVVERASKGEPRRIRALVRRVCRRGRPHAGRLRRPPAGLRALRDPRRRAVERLDGPGNAPARGPARERRARLPGAPAGPRLHPPRPGIA